VTTSEQGTEAILSFWFDEVGPDRWWVRSQETDDAIVERFRNLWQEWRSRVPESFLGSAREALAGAILFDQFSRNMFRRHADAFSTDPLALAIARGALDRGLDQELSTDERSFLYMPFKHSEKMADQERSMMLFTRLGDADSLSFAKKHHDMIARYGRFPARNAALGRPNRPGEEEAIEASKDW
jgi:uncharacterized protein (DUF924 family)